MIVPLPPSYATMRRVFYVVVLVAVAFGLGSLRGCVHAKRAADLERTVKRQEAKLKEMGYKLAERSSHPERIVPAMPPPPAGTTPLVASRTRTKPETFTVPCVAATPGPTKEPGAFPSAPVPVAGSDAPPTLPTVFAKVDVTADVQTSVVADAAGRVWAASTVDVSLTAPGWQETRRLPEGTAQVAVSPELDRAMRAWRDRPARLSLGLRPARHWRAGWVTGAGLSYDPLASRYAPAVFVGYGLSF